MLKMIFACADDLFDETAAWLSSNWRSAAVWALGACFFIGGALLLWASTLTLPDLASLQTQKMEQSVKIFDRTGTVLLYDLHNKMQRTVVPLSAISPNIEQAILAIEDPNFYVHRGIEPTAIARALFVDISSGSAAQGGSTITQQVVKGSILTSDKTITRKLKEWVLALKMERTLSKDQILELYLNQVPFGGQLYGVEEAPMTFFSKHASDVTMPEAAYLAAMLPAPSRLSPYGDHTDVLGARKNLVLDKMYEHGYTNAEDRDAAKNALISFVPQSRSSIVAPHFIFYVEQYLEDKYGTDAVERGGWKVTTTLDADLQTKAEEIVKAHALDNTGKFNASNMAMAAVDPKTGQILVMVGSRNYFDKQIPGAYNAAATPPGRQPGSAFKPFAYAQAFSEGYTPGTVLFDLPTQFSTSCEPSDNRNNKPPCYAPQDYDGKFRGPMSLRNALAQSINVPSVKVLYLAGLKDTLQLAKSMGITTLGDANQYGLTLVLGGGEVTLLDITGAYGTFAANGMHYEPQSVLRIEDAQGSIIEDNTESAGTQVLHTQVAQEISDVLSDSAARAPLGENALFSFPGYDVAVKTGTTNDYRDAWTIGYTPNIVVGAWAGNNDNKPMERRVSGFIVGPAWSEFMRYAVQKLPQESFARTEVLPASKPALSGAWQTLGGDGTIHELLYWVDRGNPAGPPPGNPYNDPQYKYWEYPLRPWAAQNSGLFASPANTGAPSGAADTPAVQSPQPTFSPSGGAIIPL